MSEVLQPIMPNTIEECCQICEAIRDKKPVRASMLGGGWGNQTDTAGGCFLPDFNAYRYDLLEEMQTQVELPELCYVLFEKEGKEWDCVAIIEPPRPGEAQLLQGIKRNCEDFFYMQMARLPTLQKLQWRAKSTDPWQPVFRKEYRIKPFNK